MTIIGVESGEYIRLAAAYNPASRKWVTEPDALRKQARAGMRFTFLDLSGVAGAVTASKPEVEEADGSIIMKTGSNRGEKPARLALFGPLGKRQPVRIQDPKNSTYEQIAAAALVPSGIRRDRVGLKQHLRMDLNADNSEDVLLTAQSRLRFSEEPQFERGAFALVLLRSQSRSGNVLSLPLVLEAPKKEGEGPPNDVRILAIADINGDGRQEILVETGYYEGGGLRAFAFDGKKATRLFQADWGV